MTYNGNNTTAFPFPEHIMSMAELKEFKALEKKIMVGSFVELDFSNPEHTRLNELSGKYLKLRNYCKKFF